MQLLSSSKCGGGNIQAVHASFRECGGAQQLARRSSLPGQTKSVRWSLTRPRGSAAPQRSLPECYGGECDDYDEEYGDGDGAYTDDQDDEYLEGEGREGDGGDREAGAGQEEEQLKALKPTPLSSPCMAQARLLPRQRPQDETAVQEADGAGQAGAPSAWRVTGWWPQTASGRTTGRASEN